MPRGARSTAGRAGLSYYVAGAGAPMLLVHSINAAGSAYEVKPIFERLAEPPASMPSIFRASASRIGRRAIHVHGFIPRRRTTCST